MASLYCLVLILHAHQLEYLVRSLPPSSMCLRIIC